MKQSEFELHRKRATEIYQQTKSSRKSAEILSKELGEYVWHTNFVRAGITRNEIIDNNLISNKTEANWLGKNNWKDAWIKDEETSIRVVNPLFKSLSIEEIKEMVFWDMENYSPIYPKIERNKIIDWHLLVIDPADIHIWKYASIEETGEEYNMEFAYKRCIEWVQGIIQKTQGFNIDKILLVIGNDIIHIDHPKRQTTAGTSQDTDGQWWEMFQTAKKLYIEVIEYLMQVADVDIVYNPSNHDYTAWYFLSDSIASWFRKSENIHLDTSISHRKYYVYGSNLIGTTHGDGAKEQDLVYLMAHESKEKWANAEYRYWYLHHIHHKKAIKYQSWKDYIGCTLEYLRTPSSADAWHDRNGYTGAKKAIEGFIHSKTEGQVSRITHYF